MSHELLKRLQSRRSFLKGSALLAASALAVPAVLSAQSQDQQSQDGQKKQDGQDPQDGQNKRDAQDQDKSKDTPQQEAKEGDGAKTFIPFPTYMERGIQFGFSVLSDGTLWLAYQPINHQTLTFNEAILRHAGEARGVTTNYRALSATQQNQIITFLKSL